MSRARAKLPGWVRHANRRLAGRTRVQSPEGDLGVPRTGDLRIARAVSPGAVDPRIVCVVDVDPLLATVRAALVGNETDLATGADLLAPAAATGLPFDLIVQSDVTGTLWWSQVERCVGRLDRRLTELVGDAVSNGAARVPRRARGMPVVAAHDPRRELKTVEIAAMRALSAECETAAGRDARPVPLVVDPALVEISSTDDAASYVGRLAAIAAELANADLPVLPAGAASVILDAWDRGFRATTDAWRGLQPCLEQALSAPRGSGARPVRYEPERRATSARADHALGEACTRQAIAGATAIRLLTTPQAWTADRPGGSSLATAHVGDGSRLRLIRHNLEVSP